MKNLVSGIQYCLTLLFLLCFCAGSWSAEDRITTLQKQISVLEEQKRQLDMEKQTLIDKGDELSHKIEVLKIQAKSGLGIIGRYKLSRNLRKAQALSEEVQILEKRSHKVESELEDKRAELEREYEHQIAILLEKLNGISQPEEGRQILEKLREYQIAKEQLAKPQKEKLEYPDVTKIEIENYDGPQEIREKADLINDFASKLNNGIDELNARVKKLKDELKTRRRLGEFAEEISFFGERISKEEIAGDSGKERGEKSAGQPAHDANIELENGLLGKDGDIIRTPITEPPTMIATQPSKVVVERNGVSVDFAGTSLDQIENIIKLMEKQKQDLEKEASILSKKADSFYQKADEVEKSETKN